MNILKICFRGASLATIVLATSCATDMSDVTKDGETMQSIYNGSFNEIEKQGAKPETPQRKLGDSIDLKGYTRDVNNETTVLFKRISNPTLVGYVFPHLTQDNIPIPAYSIPFRMSPKDHYLMPGEEEVYQ